MAVSTFTAATVEASLNWPAAEVQWFAAPELEVVRCTAEAAGNGLGSLEVRHRYGTVKRPDQSAFPGSVVAPIDRVGWWIRMKIGTDVVWVGKISSETREVFGTDTTPAGVQTFTAYEPLQLLRKIVVDKSVWEVGSDTRTLGHVPDVNLLDQRRTIIGNQSLGLINAPTSPVIQTYGFGDIMQWTHLEFLEYILAWFVDQSGEGGPAWSITGQTSILTDLTTPIRMGDTQTVADIVRRVIPRRLGIDYLIRPIPWAPPVASKGFEIFIYALSGTAQTFGSATMPVNPNTITITPSSEATLVKTKVIRTKDQQYDRIRVVGNRIVVCCSLHTGGLADTLRGKWTIARETEYKAGTGNPADDTAKHDRARRSDRFREVYQTFGAPLDWNHNFLTASIKTDATGKAITTPDVQRQVRRTLSWIPMFASHDYRTIPPDDENLPGSVGELMAPQVWLWDEQAADDPQWVTAEAAHISVSALQSEWGFHLSASPNHILGKNHFDGESALSPKYDWRIMEATIAFESDHRFGLEFDLTPASQDKGDTLVIVVPEAEAWFVADGTAFRVNQTDRTQLDRVSIANTNAGFVRNDASLLDMVMAGSVARYNAERARAEVRYKGLNPINAQIGQILETIEQGQASQFILAPITSIEWVMGESPETILRAGFAR